MTWSVYFICLFSLFFCTDQHDIKGFDDTVLFDINFPGNLAEGLGNDYTETLVVTSSLKEKYKCYLPNIVEKEETPVEPYSGPSPLELISPLFSQG